MPTPDTNATSLNMSPAGNLLAVASNKANTTVDAITAGLEVFHFNGAEPITAYSGRLTTQPIDSISWDKHNHLYAISYSTGKLYVFTVTRTSITPAAGSPYTLTGVNGMVVVDLTPSRSSTRNADRTKNKDEQE